MQERVYVRLSEAALVKEGAIGDINYSFFDEGGWTTPDWNIFPALGVDRVKEMVKANKRVAVVTEGYKLPSLKAALNGKLFNVLITDQMAAKELLNSE